MKVAVMVMMAVGVSGSAVAQGGNLQATLAKLDVASAKFESATATVHKDLFNSVAKDTTTQDGSVYFLKSKGGTLQVGLKIGEPNARTLEYKNGILRLYTPAKNCVQTISAAGHEQTANTFFALGFGGSGKELAKNFAIDDKGPETLAGMQVEHLALVPHDAKVRGTYSHMEVWLDLERGVSVKQIFYAADTGDRETGIYSNIRLNEKKVDTRGFEFKAPACGN